MANLEGGSLPPAGRVENLAGGVYGQLLVLSVVAALSEDESLTATDLFVGVSVTAIVFWLAHAYSEEIAMQLAGETQLTLRELGRILAQEWPIAQAAAPIAAILALGAVGVFSTSTAVDLAIGAGVAALFGWGVVIGRRSGRNAFHTALAAVVSASFGLVIVALKVFVVH
jgi:hypothetical protein